MISQYEYQQLAAEPMTQARYEMLCAKYSIEPTDKIAAYMDRNYDYATYGQKPQYRIYQLRAQTRYQERLAARTPAAEAAVQQAQIEALRRHEQAIREEREIDGGY